MSARRAITGRSVPLAAPGQTLRLLAEQTHRGFTVVRAVIECVRPLDGAVLETDSFELAITDLRLVAAALESVAGELGVMPARVRAA